MLLFRSEEHVDRWLTQKSLPRGEVFTVAQGFGLGAWYADRMQPDFRRRSAEEAEAFFASLGLTSGFWKLG
jgi:hypothetical protein